MRLHLLLMICFALTAWSSQVDASAMAHCQTHNQTKNQAQKQTQNDAEVLQVQAVKSIQNGHTAHAEVQVQNIIDHAHSAQFLTEPTSTQRANLHDCCEQDSGQHYCSGSCLSCDGCSTAHSAAMPMVWLMKTTIAQQKIQYFDDFYLRPQSSTQERPPKN